LISSGLPPAEILSRERACRSDPEGPLIAPFVDAVPPEKLEQKTVWLLVGRSPGFIRIVMAALALRPKTPQTGCDRGIIIDNRHG
jgi:hypothetical protein